eukprot:SAG11_NODE_137_length_15114_cov_2.297303_10_plen_182_part_00
MGATLMSPSTPLSFSIPFQTHGEIDAPGLCTIALLRLLQNSHNELLEGLSLNTPSPGGGGSTAMVYSYLSSMNALRQHLITYERERDLLPLLSIYRRDPSLTPLEPGTEGEGDRGGGVAPNDEQVSAKLDTQYDFEKVEAALAVALLQGKVPLLVHVRNFPVRFSVRNFQMLQERSVGWRN